jgi:2-polyprenyl-6-methoxyphenol hydroxylase-like FAD-dependent oxidoreductase
MRPSRSDVAIVGAGPAGSSTAIAMARRGYSVTVIEAAARRDFRIGETVPPEIRPCLQELGAWESFRRDVPLPSAGECSAWGEDELAYRDAFAHPMGGGWHLDR